VHQCKVSPSHTYRVGTQQQKVKEPLFEAPEILHDNLSVKRLSPSASFKAARGAWR